MELRLRMTRKRVAIFVAGLALVATGAAIGVTSNAYTDASGAYNGCVNSGSGLLRVLATGETCRPSEVAIDWNQVGQQGPQGVQGIQGPRGDKGDQGLQGVQGPKGEKGDTGATGAIGATGTTGPKGDKGDTGAQGIQGAQGVQGPQGASGGVSGYEIVQSGIVDRGDVPSSGLVVRCPAGKMVLGGGEFVSNGTAYDSQPLHGDTRGADGTGWVSSVHWNLLGGGFITVFATCANV